MSKGPGKWQRLILDALERCEWVFVVDLLPEEHTPSDYSAVMRAASVLARQGRLSVSGGHRRSGRKLREFKVAARPSVNVDATDPETRRILDQPPKELRDVVKTS